MTMKQHTKNTVSTWGAFLVWLALILVVMLALALTSCTKTVYVPTEHTVYNTDTVYEAVLRVDSVIQRDSIAVIQKGDTVLITKYRDRYRVKQRTDTVYKAKTDSVYVEKPVEVERKLTRWEQTKMDFGGLFLGGMIAALIGAVGLWIIKRRK